MRVYQSRSSRSFYDCQRQRYVASLKVRIGCRMKVVTNHHAPLLGFLLVLLFFSYSLAQTSPVGQPAAQANVPSIIGDLRLHQLKSKVFGNTRAIRVLLPAGYSEPANRKRRYPVLYLNDGQNLFDVSTSVFNPLEWQADEALDRLIKAKEIEPLIVVGVDNAGRSARANEYLPYPDAYLRPPDLSRERRQML